MQLPKKLWGCPIDISPCSYSHNHRGRARKTKLFENHLVFQEGPKNRVAP